MLLRLVSRSQAWFRPPQPKPEVVLGAKPADAESRQEYNAAVLASKPLAYWRLHDDSPPNAVRCCWWQRG